jgi:hypothetical protein
MKGGLGDAPEGVHTGIESGSGAGAGLPIATVLDGTGYLAIDGLASVAYTQTGDFHEIMLVKAVDPTQFHYWSMVASDADIAHYRSVLNQTGNVGVEGYQRALVATTLGAINEVGTASTQHADSRWHLIQGADYYAAPNSTTYLQTDGAAREGPLGSLARAAVSGSYPKLFTLGCRRYGAGPTIDVLNPGVIGYYALVTGVQLSAAAWGRIHDAWDTGGGRTNLKAITNAIQAEITLAGSGTLQWAAELDGGRTAPHVNASGAAAPIYVNCTFERANYDTARWAYFTAGDYAIATAADAQAVEDVYDTADADISYIYAFETDNALGGPATSRATMGWSTSVDTNGTYGTHLRATGRLSTTYVNDVGGTVAAGTTSVADEIFQGDVDLIQVFDTAVGTTGQIKAKINSRSVDTVDASYDRTLLGVFDMYSPAGFARGPTPAVIPVLGWVYWHISVAADLESISASIEAAYSAAVGQYAKYQAVKAAIIAGGFEANIIYAQPFRQGFGADYTSPGGGDATLVGVTYAAEGVSP